MTETRDSVGRPAPSVRNARRDRPVWWSAILVSVLAHALVFLSWRTGLPATEGPTAGQRAPAIVAGGGGSLRAFHVERPRPREIPPPPRPVISVALPEVAPQDVSSAFAGPALLREAPAAGLPGIGGGPGRGDGGEGGDGDGYVSPVPRSVLPHWDPPVSVRGLEVTVRVYVDERGVPSGLVELHPPTPDERFNREIRERIRRMEYRPASRHGKPVAGWAEITFIF